MERTSHSSLFTASRRRTVDAIETICSGLPPRNSCSARVGPLSPVRAVRITSSGSEDRFAAALSGWCRVRRPRAPCRTVLFRNTGERICDRLTGNRNSPCPTDSRCRYHGCLRDRVSSPGRRSDPSASIHAGYSAVSLLTSSSAFMSSAVNVTSTAFRLSSSCAIFLAPMITLVTASLARIQASAICGTVTPCAFGDRDEHVEDREPLLLVHRREIELRPARRLVAAVARELAGQEAAGQRAPDEQAQPLILRAAGSSRARDRARPASSTTACSGSARAAAPARSPAPSSAATPAGSSSRCSAPYRRAPDRRARAACLRCS